eukprot:MONOS_16134.1-p1 / transcript=MONOS_16134.1 / gene=MONOS_16134 / organism=Monocercomonoides_exilis_PA203 / gene_product=unspecified product / transcript_product=unspecified product / location=Mono_scaffold01521:1201-2481(-) / protein_length=345 / sequence_SO=supercontig / SO=protein_coding / is_pseudo=false
MATISIIERFTELFSKLEDRNEEDQKQKISEMKGIIDEMNKEEFKSVITKELFDKICRIFEEKKLPAENMILLLKHVGCVNVLKNVWVHGFEESSLKEKIKKMMIDESEKDEGKREKLLADLCECYLMLNIGNSSELYPICVPCLLKVALKKEENEETQNEAEMALLALCCICSLSEMEPKLFLNETKDIIKYHQEHHNLTRLAYQSAWEFLICRLWSQKSLEDAIIDELHFCREAERELKELMKCVDWKRKEEIEKGKETKEEIHLVGWLRTLKIYLEYSGLHGKEQVDLINLVIQIFQESNADQIEIRTWCMSIFRGAAGCRAVKIKDLLESGAADVILEEI